MRVKLVLMAFLTPDPKHPGRITPLTLLVFKDNQAARAFQIPLSWISRLGWVFGLLIGVNLLTAVLAVRFYLASKKADPTYVVDLEQQLIAAKEANLAARETKHSAAQETQTPAPVVQQAQTPIADTAPPVAAPVTAPISAPLAEAVTPQAVQPVTAPIATQNLPLPLPEEDSYLSPDFLLKIEQPVAAYQGSKLDVKFNLTYASPTPGNQKGRFIVVARGSKGTYTYPMGGLASLTPLATFNWEKGEYFSVSRFREAFAELDKAPAKADLRSIEILIYDNMGILLAMHKIKPAQLKAQGSLAPRREVAPPPVAPTAAPTQDPAAATAPAQASTPEN